MTDRDRKSRPRRFCISTTTVRPSSSPTSTSTTPLRSLTERGESSGGNMRTVAIGDDDCRAGARENLRARSANTRAATGYQCDAISEVAHEDTLSRIVAFAIPPLSHIVHSP